MHSSSKENMLFQKCRIITVPLYFSSATTPGTADYSMVSVWDSETDHVPGPEYWKTAVWRQGIGLTTTAASS